MPRPRRGSRATASRAVLVRWSWRDLRHRWLSVVVIAAIIAIGTGVFAALGSSATWRRLSNDASYAALAMHDVRATLSPGTTVDEGTLERIVTSLDDVAAVTEVQERLIVATQLDASTGDETVLVPGRIVGTDLTAQSRVDTLDLTSGTVPTTGADVVAVVVEQKFATHYHLPDSGEITLSGGRRVHFTGHGVTPEYFLVTGIGEGGFLAEANYGILFTSLRDAQRLADLDGQVSDVVVRLAPGSDRDAFAAALDAALTAQDGISVTVTTRDEDPSLRLLYDDIKGDQKVWNALSALVLFAASLAAFNLVGRIVESQRREVGVQMALAVPPRLIIVRPLLVAAQIALLGSVLGVCVGLLVGRAMRSLFVDLLPMPIWLTPFQPGNYVAAAALGFVVPFVATIWPIRRAVRVEPMEAIRTAALPSRSGRFASLSHRLVVPGGSLAQLPVRNTMRRPRRTALTAIGIGAAITVLVGVLGMLDSVQQTIDNGVDELVQDHPDRVTLELSSLEPASGDVVASIVTSPLVGRADPLLQLPATLRSASGGTDDSIDALVTIMDLTDAAWTPTITDVSPAGDRPGIVLAREAAADLGVAPGDVLLMRHPAADEAGGLTLITSEVTVVGLHPNPLRAFAYVDASDAAALSLPPVVNTVEVEPATGVSTDQLRRAMFAQDGIASAQPISALTKVFDDAMAQFIGFLVLTAGAVLVMALLIAFNSTSIALDERTRENATLFAFGLPVRSVVAILVKENLLIGIGATAVGVGVGYLLVRWMVGSLIATTVPDIGFVVTISASTVLIALAVGVTAVAMSPLLLIRRLQRMDIPDALRVME